MKKLLLALALVTVISVPAFASVQNIKVSGDIDATYLFRDSFSLGSDRTTDDQRTEDFQSLFITQTRLRVDADLTDNVSTTVALINERAWDDADGNTSDIDLNLAYITLREMLYSPLTVIIGRQSFAYGNSFLVDSAGTNTSAPVDSGISAVAGDLTKQTAQDAVRLILDYKPLTLELLASKISGGTVTSSREDDDTDLFGLNANYELGDDMKTVVEAYFFSRFTRVNNESVSTGNKASKNDTLYVPGLRVSTNPIEGLNTQVEVAWQRGTKVATTNTIRNNQQREAMGAQFIASYWIPVSDSLKQYKPMAQYVYTYVSGDSNPSDGAPSDNTARLWTTNEWTAWDPLFENQASGKIYNTLFNLSNAHIHAVTLGMNPMEDVNIKGTWTSLHLDKRVDSTSLTLLQPDGVSTTSSTYLNGRRGGKDLGNEFDVETTYNYTEDVLIGANMGVYFPGALFDGLNDDVAKQAIVHVNVNF